MGTSTPGAGTGTAPRRDRAGAADRAPDTGVPRTAPARGRRRAARVLPAVLGFGLALGAGTAGVVALLRAADGTGPVVERCAAASDGTSWYLDPDQAETAALITATTLHRGMPARAATIAIATGLQESKLRNIDYGDRDSLGVFQQRPSQGWGTPEQVQDPVYATGAFLDALSRVEGYEGMEITVAAQTVQRSAYPDAYGQHESRSRAWASALAGWSPAALTCTLQGSSAPGDAAGLAGRAARDFAGTVPAVVGEDGAVVLDAGPLGSRAGDAGRAGWAVAQWAVAVAGSHGVAQVQHADQVWDRAEGAWVPAPDPLPAGQVRVLLAG